MAGSGRCDRYVKCSGKRAINANKGWAGCIYGDFLVVGKKLYYHRMFRYLCPMKWAAVRIASLYHFNLALGLIWTVVSWNSMIAASRKTINNCNIVSCSSFRERRYEYATMWGIYRPACVLIGADLWAGGKVSNLRTSLLSPSLGKSRPHPGPNDDRFVA